MKKVFLTVGPSQNYPTVAKHLKNGITNNILSISHRGDLFHQMFSENVGLLKKLLKIPSSYNVFFISSGTEGMELSINNCVDQKSFHLITGAFGDKFFNIAKGLGKKAESLKANFGEGIDSDKLEKLNLSNYELLCATENDTSGGIYFPMEKVYEIKNKNLLIAVDSVSAVPFGNLNYKYLDLVFFSVQKGFGLPSGLGIIVVSPKALEKAQKLLKLKKDIGTYHNFPTLLSYSKKAETPETPNVLAIYLLNKVLKDMLSYGISKIRKETVRKAKIIYEFLDNNSYFEPLVGDTNVRSQTTIVAKTKGSSKDVISFLNKIGIFVGRGYGENKDKHIRIGNFPSHTIEDVKRLIKALEEFI
ncbi:MAG: alanine--glyoxylate aminotransferase family protein [Candidatus Levybacteria bacterium]|nr:alanine--glyoxylate aminotransferase family protein [Candidatus Levybacteria bacterium]